MTNDEFNRATAEVMNLEEFTMGMANTKYWRWPDGSAVRQRDWNPATSLDDMRVFELWVCGLSHNLSNGYRDELVCVVREDFVLNGFGNPCPHIASVEQRKAAIEAIWDEIKRTVSEGVANA